MMNKEEVRTFSIKLWKDENAGQPELIQQVMEIRRDKENGDFIIETVFEDIRVPYNDELKIEVN